MYVLGKYIYIFVFQIWWKVEIVCILPVPDDVVDDVLAMPEALLCMWVRA